MIQKKLMLIAVVLMDILGGMEFDIFTPSFPRLKSLFELSTFEVELLLSVNFVAYCISLMFVGTLSDNYGRKPVILWGTAIFIVGSVLCIFPETYYMMLAGRFLQGLGIAAPALLSFVIIADEYPLEKQQYYLAMLNGVTNVSIGLAPIIGSYLTLYFDWHGNFHFLLWFGVMIMLMTILWVPDKKPVPIEKQEDKTKYSHIFRSKSLMVLISCMVFMFAPHWIFVGVSPVLYMVDLNVELTHFGYYQGALAGTFAIASVIFGMYMHKFKPKSMLVVSMYLFIVSIIGILAIAIFDVRSPLIITCVINFVGMAQLAPSVLLYPASMNYLPNAKGRISAVIQAYKLLMSALGLQLAGHFYDHSFRSLGIIMVIYFILGTYLLSRITRSNAIMLRLSEKKND